MEVTEAVEDLPLHELPDELAASWRATIKYVSRVLVASLLASMCLWWHG